MADYSCPVSQWQTQLGMARHTTVPPSIFNFPPSIPEILANEDGGSFVLDVFSALFVAEIQHPKVCQTQSTVTRLPRPIWCHGGTPQGELRLLPFENLAISNVLNWGGIWYLQDIRTALCQVDCNVDPPRWQSWSISLIAMVYETYNFTTYNYSCWGWHTKFLGLWYSLEPKTWPEYCLLHPCRGSWLRLQHGNCLIVKLNRYMNVGQMYPENSNEHIDETSYQTGAKNIETIT